MRILWDVGFVLPDAAHLADGCKIAFGGWVGAMISQLSITPEIELGVAMKAPVDYFRGEKIGNVQYYVLPQSKKDKFDINEQDCRAVLKDFKPDILHVEGSELTHANTFLKCWEGKNILSMQGIINGYEPYEYGSLPIDKMLLSFHPVEAIVAVSMILNKKLLFRSRLITEEKTIRMADNILGRTTWDRAHAYAINPNASYFQCNRILREPFYKMQWDLDRIEPHSIFIGNAASPRKGAHFVLHALALLKREYPDVKLYVAGESPALSSRQQWKKLIGYQAYLRHLVKKLNLTDCVEFTGILHTEAMVGQLLKSHVYVLSSVIENSPNTLGEAMMMGVPSVAAYVGGIPDMANGGSEALFYRDNDPELLAFQIKRIFDDNSLAKRLSENARRKAMVTHEPQKNLQKMLDAYQEILLSKPEQF